MQGLDKGLQSGIPALRDTLNDIAENEIATIGLEISKPDKTFSFESDYEPYKYQELKQTPTLEEANKSTISKEEYVQMNTMIYTVLNEIKNAIPKEMSARDFNRMVNRGVNA